jgi:Flp pilus assembly pilin Flp
MEFLSGNGESNIPHFLGQIMPKKQSIRHWLPARINNDLLACARQLRQCGATSIEYALLSALIAVVILGTVSITGLKVLELWTYIEFNVTDALDQ